MVSMPYGPVLSATYDCFMGDREYWDSWIINPGNYDLALNSSVKVDPADPLDTFDELSVAEKTVLDSVYSKFGASNRWNLVKLLHDPDYCPEWENPQGSSYPIHIKSLLMKNGKTKEENIQLLLDGYKELQKIIPSIADAEMHRTCGGTADLILITHFKDKDELDAYVNHPEHQKYSAFCKTVRETRTAADYFC